MRGGPDAAASASRARRPRALTRHPTITTPAPGTRDETALARRTTVQYAQSAELVSGRMAAGSSAAGSTAAGGLAASLGSLLLASPTLTLADGVTVRNSAGNPIGIGSRPNGTAFRYLGSVRVFTCQQPATVVLGKLACRELWMRSITRTDQWSWSSAPKRARKRSGAPCRRRREMAGRTLESRTEFASVVIWPEETIERVAQGCRAR